MLAPASASAPKSKNLLGEKLNSLITSEMEKMGKLKKNLFVALRMRLRKLYVFLRDKNRASEDKNRASEDKNRASEDKNRKNRANGRSIRVTQLCWWNLKELE